MEEDVEFRQGLPLDYLTYMGVQNSDKVQNQILFYQLYTSSSSHSPLCCVFTVDALKRRLVLVQDDPRRSKFFSRIDSLMKKLTDYAPVDAAVDQKARDFLHDCLPPVLTPGMEGPHQPAIIFANHPVSE